MKTPINIIYIAGSGRSGSTILDRVIGSLETATSLGEVGPIWRHGFLENRNCSCGQPFNKCLFWSKITENMGISLSEVDHIYDLHRAVNSSNSFISLYTGIYSASTAKKLKEYRGYLYLLYSAILELTGSKIIIDSSKISARALILGGIPNINLHVIHLIRDARPVVYAWQKIKQDPATGEPMKQYSPLHTNCRWMTHHIMSELLRYKFPYSKVFYEEFANSPRTTIENLLNEISFTSGMKAAFQDEKTVNFKMLHSISGNPHRFSAGVTELKLDSEWKRKMNLQTRLMTTVINFPLLVRYGYLLRGRKPV